ncbi:MAG: cyclic nucleotide-binding domain-containing protein [Deltaproteobacteria bacterium]|nr:cyclic nucleotide-binding domain-containing protein [Deltaproteobacteria bacterium]
MATTEATGFRTRTFNRNEVIFQEGASGDAAYILREGRVEVSIRGGAGKVVLSVLEPVTVFGEMAVFLGDHRRVATVTALEHTEVVEVGRDALESYLEDSPPFIASIIKSLVERLRNVNNRVLRSPDVFWSVCEVLNLLNAQAKDGLDYPSTVKAISAATGAEAKAIESRIDLLDTVNLISIRDAGSGKVIALEDRDEFLNRALKVRNALTMKAL